MPKPVIHVLFTPSGAGTLRQTLTQQGLRQKVLCCFDDFSFGPIGRGDPARIAWAEEELGVTDWDSVVIDTEPFLRKSCSRDTMPIVWTSRSDARSHAGFHWWLSHRGDAPCKVIDVTDEIASTSGKWPRAVSPGSLLPDEMARLLGTEVELPPFEREAYQNRWRQLVAENAPFRVVTPDGSLQSAPITWFDPLLLSCATTEWSRPALIVGKALGEIWEQYARQAGDLVLFARLYALAESGVLEWRGQLGSMRDCEIRLPQSA